MSQHLSQHLSKQLSTQISKKIGKKIGKNLSSISGRYVSRIMDQPVALSVPAPIRAIFAQWAEGCDPGPLRPGDDPRERASFYRRLAENAAEMHLARHAVARIYSDAAVNMAYGQFAELRREGAAVYPWIAQLVAADPVLARQLG